jgi:hypothetical protein
MVAIVKERAIVF